MNVEELLRLTRNTLQDQKKIFWDDSELLGYYEEARRVIASERNDKRTTQIIVLEAGTELYAPEGVLRYISIKDDLGNNRPLYPNDGSGDMDTMGITVVDFDQINVHDDTLGSVLTVTFIGLPLNHNLNSDVRQGDEEALRYFMLSRAYEKETDMENFAKAGQFKISFDDRLRKLVGNASMNYNNQADNRVASHFF